MSKKVSSKIASQNEGSNETTTTSPTGPSCPICSKPSQQKYRPFCSKRCADIDLNRWLTDQYAIPAPDEEPDDDDLFIKPPLN